MSLKKNSDVEAQKLHLEYAFDNGIDFKNRIIRITTSIGEGGFTFDYLDGAMNEMENHSKTEPITIKINSPGGDVYETFAMMGRIKNSSCPIITEAYGHCMSAATLLLMCADRRKISKYCVAMFHKISYHIAGSHDDITDHVKQSEIEMKNLIGFYEEFSNKPARFWTAKITKKEFYPSPKDLLEYGAVDEII